MFSESLRERFGERTEVPIRHEALKLLASDTRLRILKMLDARRMTVSELARALDLNKSTVHEHLGKLVEGGLLRRDESAEREWVYYELTKTGHYVLKPSTARFVLVMGATVVAAVVGIALLHVLLTAGQGLALAADGQVVPAGESHAWQVDVTRPGFLGFRQPADAQLHLLTANEAAEYQLTGTTPPTARALGPQDSLASDGKGRYRFQASLGSGVHYLLASAGPGDRPALLPLRADPVDVTPRQPSVLLGLDPSQVEMTVNFRGAPVYGGLVEALDERGREVAQVPVLNGKAVMPLDQPADKVAFRYKSSAPGSSFAEATGTLHASAPVVAFEPSQVPLLAQTEVRVVVDDPLLGPRANAPVSVVASDGRVVARGATNADGAGEMTLHLVQAGDFIVKAGQREVGKLVAKPGLRLWVDPGTHYTGERFRVRTQQLGDDPAVGQVSVLVDGREVGMSDADGWLSLEFVFPGRYHLEARREGFVPAHFDVEASARGYTLGTSSGGFAAPSLASAPPASEATRVEPARLALGQVAQVRAVLRNPDDLPRVVVAVLREDGQAIQSRAVPVPAGGAVPVMFDYAPRTPGSHLLQVNDLPGERVEVASVGAPEPASRATPGAPLAAAVVALAGLALVVRRRS